MKNRIRVYEGARKRHPERWSGDIRDWSLPGFVALNPIAGNEIKDFSFANNLEDAVVI
ncbi:MAG: hypothetical protein GX974_08230 [Clostridiales bacterium]|nr:hypothetical protein [Clostridiales bacterium]